MINIRVTFLRICRKLCNAIYIFSLECPCLDSSECIFSKGLLQTFKCIIICKYLRALVPGALAQDFIQVKRDAFAGNGGFNFR